MNLQEAIDYMRKTGNSVFVKNPKYVSDFEYKLGTWDTRGYTCLKHNRFYQNGKRVWRDVEMSAVDILEEMLSYTYEPHIEYLSFLDAVKMIQEDLCLTFTRTYYQESFYNNGWGRERDPDNNNYLVYTIDDGKEGAGIRIYNASHKEYYSPAMHDILASDWYVTEVKK